MRPVLLSEWNRAFDKGGGSNQTASGTFTVQPVPSWLRMALAALLLISIEVSAYQVRWYFAYGPVASDLRIFTTGVEIVRSGDRHRLYRFETQRDVQARLYPETRRAGIIPYNHLAYELLLYWPLAKLPYRTALVLWAVANLALVLAIALLLRPHVAAFRQASGLPVALWLLGFYPVLYVLAEGQDSLVFLTMLVLSLRCADRGWGFLAGFLLGLVCFKLHIALLIGFLVFVVRWRWRGIAGFATAAGAMIGVSWLMVGPSFASDYVLLLSRQEVESPWGFVSQYMPNLRGLLFWAFSPGPESGALSTIVLLISAALLAGASWAIFEARRRQDEVLVYSAATLSTVLASYHLHMQDLAIAVLPMLVLLDFAMRGAMPRAWTGALWLGIAALYAFRLTAEFVPTLLKHGCLLTIPLLVVWLASLRLLVTARARTCPPIRSPG